MGRRWQQPTRRLLSSASNDRHPTLLARQLVSWGAVFRATSARHSFGWETSLQGAHSRLNDDCRDTVRSFASRRCSMPSCNEVLQPIVRIIVRGLQEPSF